MDDDECLMCVVEDEREDSLEDNSVEIDEALEIGGIL